MTNIRWLVLLLIGSGQAALAQTTASRPPTFGATPRAAAGQPARQVSVRASLETSYESNIFGISDTLARTRVIPGRTRDDVEISPSLQLDIVLPFGGRQSAFLRGQLGYDFHLNNQDLDRERIILDGGANIGFGGSCSSSLTGSYGRFRTNAGDVFIVTPGAVNFRNNVVTRKSIGGQVRCGGAIGLSPSFGYQHSETRNKSPLFELNDSNQDAFDASIGYQRPTLGRVSIYGTYVKGEYLGRDILFNRRTLFPISEGPNPFFNPNALDGVTSYSAGIRFERDIGTRAYGTVAVGYSWVDPKSPLSRKFRGNSYQLNLSLRPSERLSVDLLASRSADLSNSVFATYSVTDVYSLNGTYRLADRLRLNFGSSIQTRDFRVESGANDQVAFLTNDEFVRAYGGVIYDLNRRLRLNALISQQSRKSDNSIFNYTNTTVSAGISFALGR